MCMEPGARGQVSPAVSQPTAPPPCPVSFSQCEAAGADHRHEGQRREDIVPLLDLPRLEI